MDFAVDGDELETLLAEQRREFSAAIAADNDLNLAFHLQLQEALTASLRNDVVPVPSSTIPVPNRTVPNNTVSYISVPNDAVPVLNDVVPVTNDAASLAHLLDEEIENVKRRRIDRSLAEEEMQKIKDEISRRSHDHAFAREIYNVAEGEWIETGDNIERPYGEGMEDSDVVFKIYFKGLVRGESVAIGVAICDSCDNVVLEIGKVLLVGDRSGSVAEVKAMIEAVNMAVMLGLRRVEVCFDNYSIYQYVIGKWQPKQSKIATLVDQAKLLLRKFAKCNLSLVGTESIRSAIELAIDAIKSQATRPKEKTRGKNIVETCTICLEDMDAAQFFSVDICLHKYCFSCMGHHVEAKLLQGMLPECPYDGCGSEMKLESCKTFLIPEMYNLMRDRTGEASIPASEKIYCPHKRCSALMSKAEVEAVLLPSVSKAAGVRKCARCHGLFCVNCKVPWHENMSCGQYKRNNPWPSASDAKLESLANRNQWSHCPMCNHVIELAEGCYHIYCRCGYEFCYTCGAEWKNKKPTCKCPIWDEPNIIRPEPVRRR